eukprot:GHVQ01042673.1.p1 GENE.GHVQ01042673.1~~GHVQ01042673.1.p1  ORF type:complete len:601 (+),score=53.31 GHVQ01042673.1:464-2266(+)
MCQEFADTHNLTDYFGPNESILHTEFYRQKAEPGTIIIGADSHSCSHGCVGAYAMGMGASDVTMPLVTGTSWLKVPETVLIEFHGKLPWGMVGKDVMLLILKLFGRNTIALDKCVEFGGNIEDLDIDSRFALSNMATEFGALAGIFPGDEISQGFIDKRKNQDGLSPPVYFRADADARYCKRLHVNLEDVRPFVARWPSPDHVFDVNEDKLFEPLFDDGKKVCNGIRHLDGVFIGACTTTENEIILAGMVLEVAMRQFGMKAKQRCGQQYKRKITPGSMIMTRTLEEQGILKIFKEAGFEVGASGCSYCLGVAADKAQPNEIWLSSQNRNFRNRMGRGAIGSVSSAAVVAASSFEMTVSDPSRFLRAIDHARMKELTKTIRAEICITEPTVTKETTGLSAATKDRNRSLVTFCMRAKCQRFGDSIDTDSIIPAPFIPLRGEDLGSKAFHYYRTDFVEKVQNGATIVVAGEGFGCGSSREEAVSCLVFCGVKAIIAKSFSFIFGRNLLTLNMLGINISDDEFYKLAEDGSEIEVDVPARHATVLSHPDRIFTFELPPIVEEIYKQGGVVNMYKTYGSSAFAELANSTSGGCGSRCDKGEQW